MLLSSAKKTLTDLFEQADVIINGQRSRDIQVLNDNFYQRVINQGSLGLGESYMDKWWTCEALDQFIGKVLSADLENRGKYSAVSVLNIILSRLLNFQSRKRAFQVGEHHYDIGNGLYKRMLDKRMLYTCGYWRDAENLDEAQEAKLELVCKKIGLEPGMTVLDLGCGFGGFAKYASEKYDVSVTGYTVSKKQTEHGTRMTQGLPVEIRHDDYRNAHGKYDRVVSIGLMEHVGYKNYRTFMELMDRTLKDDGIAFVHTIGGNKSSTICNPWTEKYIFPNSAIPSISQIGKAMEGLFVMEDFHNFGEDYDKTLMAWYHNFIDHWPELKSKYDDRFYRMWSYYLLSCAGSFRCRSLQLWQIVMTKKGTKQPVCRFN